VLLSPDCAGRIETTTDLDAALEGAALVIIQIRVGGLEARIHDESFPLSAGVPGDEGLGPGGLAAAWRTWPVLREILATCALRCPDSDVALLSAPLGILTRCAADAYPNLRIAGLCELPSVVLHEISEAVGEAHLQYDYVGVNHLGWFTRLEAAGGEDLLDAYAATRNGTAFPTGALIRELSAVPLPYVRLHEARSDVVEEQRAAPRRGYAVASMAATAMQAYSAGNREDVRRALAARHAPWYERAVAPWIDAHLEGSSAQTFFLTRRNEQYLQNADPESVLEIPNRMRDGQFSAKTSPTRVPKAVSETLEGFIAYEALAAEVVAAADAHRLARVLAAHPWVAGATTAASLVDGVRATI
jgi:6-phospho-beta-glucosidase